MVNETGQLAESYKLLTIEK